jgi:hypothetical protein
MFSGLPAACRQHFRAAKVVAEPYQTMSRQAAETNRLAACAPQTPPTYREGRTTTLKAKTAPKKTRLIPHCKTILGCYSFPRYG